MENFKKGFARNDQAKVTVFFREHGKFQKGFARNDQAKVTRCVPAKKMSINMSRDHAKVAHRVFLPRIEHRKWATRRPRQLEEKSVVRTRVGSVRKSAALKALVGYLVVTQIQTDV